MSDDIEGEEKLIREARELIDDPLQKMLIAQLEFQHQLKASPKLDPHYLRDMKDALESELDELQNETGWKPWATSRHVNLEAAQGEWIDAWHFFMNMALALRLDSATIQRLYFAKLEKNKARQAAGYDGVSTKCPKCKRALDDNAVTCFLPTEDKLGYCTKFQEMYDA